ncbi:two-component system response regulator YesN [Salibacterium salarium]|uniref:Helix-turn-helix domain-containing protein n=1 Tax=Salibacterium salarium TaxID=284579 RepID=A0A3R9P5R1_9BACI|nr:helix-turn-helix domain-containing protein [Salibacterium salarium]MDQ0300521.1 two-component system response regulator YesN [Salibacterium salarium]RSL31780.1 helix-turn-helix domain-containing protein [Salibacterium salarium]
MKVLLAEDNYKMLEFMYQCVPWKDHGLQVTAKCETGMEAWSAAQQETPDMVITDISMPGMDGLDLIEKLSDVNPNMESLIITCHDDFEYARKALRLYVGDYILKETLEPSMLLEAVQRMKQKLEEHKAGRHHIHQLKSFVEHSKKSLKKEWIHSFMDGADEKTDLLAVSFTTSSYIPVFGRFLNHQNAGAEAVLEPISTSIVKEWETADYILCSPDKMYWFFPCNRKITIEQISMELTRIQRYVEREMGESLVFVLGKQVGNWETLRSSLQQIKGGEEAWFYITEPGIYTPDQLRLNDGENDIFIHYTTALHDVKKMIAQEDEKAAEQWVQSWMEYIKQQAYHPEQIKSWIHKILTDIELKYQSLQHYSDKSSSVLYSEIYILRHMIELDSYLRNYIRQKIIQAANIRESSDRREIWDAKKYVDTHLDQKITMEGAANHLHLNPSHFSRLFKQETGETFVEYTTNKKMEQAAHDLLHTNHTVDDIALSIGYDNTSYFTKLFKKFSGCSPKQYRKDR